MDVYNTAPPVFDAIVTGTCGYVQPAIESLIASMVFFYWTAYESLAVDLWVASVNDSNALAEAFISYVKDGRTGRSRNSEQGKAQERSMPLINLQRYGYDLRGKMGTVLRDENKVRFDGFRDVQSVYKAVFGIKAENAFKNANDVQVVEAVRNLIAHRAGKMDKEFIERVERRPAFSASKVGDQLELTVASVRPHVDTLIRSSIVLAKFVDECVTSHDRS
jgi:hypothetical protein